MVNLIKHFILKALSPLEKRGVQFTMRRKIVPPRVLERIQDCRSKSFCPFIHFEMVWRSLEFLNFYEIPGDVVLCGVATGGLAKFMLEYLGPNRSLWLYDTFDGGTLPGEQDGNFEREKGAYIKSVMAPVGGFKSVCEYVEDGSKRCLWIVGDIMETLPKSSPSKIALLYLDTDYYETTLHELNCLEPLVSNRGIIIQDDMGLLQGASRAVKEFYKDSPPFIIPIDEAGCIWLKHS